MADALITTGIDVAGTRIRETDDGLFNLNDCHLAAGGSASKKPSNFLRAKQTIGLIEALQNEDRCSYLSSGPVKTVAGGPNQGTYVTKELVYAYAMWVSPAFHLKVIRVFDAVSSQHFSDYLRVERDCSSQRVALSALSDEVSRVRSESSALKAGIQKSQQAIIPHALVRITRLRGIIDAQRARHMAAGNSQVADQLERQIKSVQKACRSLDSIGWLLQLHAKELDDDSVRVCHVSPEPQNGGVAR